MARAEARRLRQLAAATKIQAAVRMHAARSSYLRTRSAVLLIQAAYRGHTARAVATDLKCVHFPIGSLMQCRFAVVDAVSVIVTGMPSFMTRHEYTAPLCCPKDVRLHAN